MIGLVERALGEVGGIGRTDSDSAAGSAGFELHFLLRDGGAGPRDTAQALVFDRRGLPLAVAKVAHGAPGRDGLRREHDRLARLAATLLVRRPGAVPRPLALRSEGEWTVLIESHLPGRRLKDLDPDELDRRPQILDLVVDWLTDLSGASGVKRTPTGEVVRSRLEGPIAAYRAAFERSAPEEAFLDSLAARLAEALGPEAPLVWGHGDFSDANILVEGDSVAVIDWDEPAEFESALPAADLFYLLCSLAATRHGLGTRDGFERGFAEAFLARSPVSRRFRRAWDRYRAHLALPAAAALPLFAAAWIDFALQKLRYLEDAQGPLGPGPARARRLLAPQDNYPVTFFADGRCLNLALTAENAEAFAL